MTEKKLMHSMLAMSIVFSIMAVTILGISIYYMPPVVMADELSGEAIDANKTEDCLVVPVPEGFASDDVEITADFYEKNVHLCLKSIEADFYKNNPLRGNRKHINNIGYSYHDGIADIDIILDDYLEYNLAVTSGELFLGFVAPKDIYKKIIVIDPGHGGNDEGTVAYGIKESVVASAIAQRLSEELLNKGYGVYLTRYEDVDVAGESRQETVEGLGADIVVSIHCQGNPKTRTAKGTECVYSTSESEQLALKISDALQKLPATANRGVERCTGIKLLDEAKNPAVVVETGYLTNKSEALMLSDAGYQGELAISIADGIEEYFNE